MYNYITNGITKSELKFHVNSLGNTGILTEFLDNFKTSNRNQDHCQIGLRSENNGLSRYRDIYCLDSTRVKLLSSRFIHANYVDGAFKPKKYILTQGPNRKTIGDFFEMVIEHESNIIVDLTRMKECGENKCVPYWSFTSKATIDDRYTVYASNATMKNYNIIESDLIFQKCDTIKMYPVKHIHYLNWPDHGIPNSTKEMNYLIDFIEYLYVEFEIKKQMNPKFPKTPPIIVHCNAGVGRSGLFALISIIREFYTKRGKIDIKNTLKLLRQQRLHSVQTPIQYMFCYHAINDYMDLKPINQTAQQNRGSISHFL